MTGALADIGVIEAAYHDGVVAGVAAYVGNTRSIGQNESVAIRCHQLN